MIANPNIPPPPVCDECNGVYCPRGGRTCVGCGEVATVTVYVVDEPGAAVARRKYECDACASIDCPELIARSV